MTHVRIIDLTETYKVLDGIKNSTGRIDAAKATVLEQILLMIEGMQVPDFKNVNERR